MGSDRVLGMTRLAVVRLRRRWAMSAALGFGILVAVALATSAGVIEAVTAEAGLQTSLSGLGPGGFVTVGQRNLTGTGLAKFSAEPGYAYFLQGARSAVSENVGPLLHPSSSRIETEDYQAFPVAGADTAGGQAQLAVYDGLDSHVRYVEGGPATAPPAGQDVDVTVSADAARRLGMTLGRRFCFLKVADLSNVSFEAGEHFCVRPVGIWRQRQLDDPYWSGLPPPASALTLGTGAYFSLLRLLPTTHSMGVAVFAPDLSRFHESEAGDIVDRFRRLRSVLTLRDSSTEVSTRLDGVIQDFESRLGLARFVIELVLAQLLLIALYYVAFVSSHALAQQRRLFAVWRSQGWSWHAIWRLLMTEVVALAAAAAPLGLVLGWAGSVLLSRSLFPGRVPWLPAAPASQVLAYAAVALLAALAVFAPQAAASARRDLLDERRWASRPELRGWWQWRALDVALATLAIPVLAATRLIGQSRLREQAGTTGDVLVIALPGIALFLVGLPLLRALPLAVRVARPDRWGLASALAGLQLGRRPVQHAGLALLLLVTIALGVFAGTYATTAPRNAADRAAYQAGADLRAHLTGSQPDVAGAVAALPGVRSASQADRDSAAAEGASFQATLLAVDPYSFRTVSWDRPDLNPRPLSQLVQQLASQERGGLALPGRPDRAGIWAFSAGLQHRLSLDVVDATGRPGRALLGILDFSGWRHLEAPLAFGSGPVVYPLKVRQLAVEPVARNAAGGQLGLSQLTVGAGSQAPPVVVEQFAGTAPDRDSPYWWATFASHLDRRLFAPAGFQLYGRPAVRFDVPGGSGALDVRPPPSYGPVPVLAPGATIRRLGLSPGQTFRLVVDSVDVQFALVDEADHVPTLYPETEDFLVADQAPLLDAIGYRGGERAWPNEVWLTVDPGADAAALAALQARPDVDGLSDRRQLSAQAVRDPLLLQLESHLLIGFAAALALAVLGFVLHFVIAARSRLGELAILQANGLARRQVVRSMAIEQAFLLGFSAVLGAGMGLALAWTLIPSLQLGTDISSLVPAPVLSVDPLLVSAAVGAEAGLALLAAHLASRWASRFELVGQLRLLG